MKYVSLQDYMAGVITDNSYTPDIGMLARLFEVVPVFLYGTEQASFSEHYILEHSPKIGIGYTSNAHYEMYITEEHQPVIVNNPASANAQRIRGELYGVTPEVLSALDQRFANGMIFHRRSLVFAHYDPQEKDKLIKTQYLSEAFAYVGDKTYWQEKNRKSKLFQPNPFYPKKGGKGYHYFTKAQDKAWSQ